MNRSRIAVVLAGVIACAACGSLHAAVRYVSVGSGSNGNDGSSGAPWKTITYALATVVSGDVINVAAGRYTPTTETFPLVMKNGVSLQGAGFLTTAIDAGSVSGRRVITCTSITVGTIEGFSIEGGYATTGNPTEDAAAIYATGSYLTIKNNRFTKNRNTSNQNPSVINCNGGAPQFINNLVVGNFADRSTIRVSGASTPKIVNNTIVGNHSSAQWDASALHVAAGTPAIKNCIIWGNAKNLLAVQATVSNCCVGGTFGGLNLDTGFPGVNGNISTDPLLVYGYFLAQTAAGQAADSPCAGTGVGTPASWGLGALTTRSDGQADSHSAVDMGFHFPVSGYVVGARVHVDRASGIGDDSRSLALATNAATPWRTITNALAQAGTGLGWTINVATGVYDTTTEAFPLTLVDTVTLQGAGYLTTTIDAKRSARVIRATGVVKGGIDGFTLTGGKQGDTGGGFYGYGSSLTISRNHIFNNRGGTAGGGGVAGGLSLFGGCPLVVNNLIVSNSADRFPGINVGSYGRATILNNTLSRNIANNGDQHDSGAINILSGTPTIRNCIVWNNTKNLSYVTSPMITYSCVGGSGGNGFPGVNGNISSDPAFVASGDYRIPLASPVVDFGANQTWMATGTDLDGNPRTSHNTVDMGAYEYQFDIRKALINNGVGATNVTTTCAWLTGFIEDIGAGEPTVTVYLGPADAGEDNPTGWATNVTLSGTQDAGHFTVEVTGLAPDTTYYYRCNAVNGGGGAWAALPSVFITGEVGLTKAADAAERLLVRGVVTVTRPTAVTNAPVTVAFSVGGTAVPGINYVDNLGTSVLIPAGVASVPLTVTPLNDWASQSDTTVTITLRDGPYAIAAPGAAAVTITNRPFGSVDVHVDIGSGDDANDGSASAPWKTIGRALSLVSSSDVVNVSSGFYGPATETFPLVLPNGVTLQGAGFLTTTLDAGSANGRRVLTCTDVTVGKVDGFTIAGSYHNDGAVYALRSNVTLSNNRLTRNRSNSAVGASAMTCDGVGSPRIVNNLIVGNLAFRSTVRCKGGATPLLANNTFAGNCGDPKSWDSGAIHRDTSGGAVKVMNCILWGNAVNITDGSVATPLITVSNSCLGGLFGEGDSNTYYLFNGTQPYINAMVFTNNNTTADPRFVSGYFLSQTAAGQSAQSPCTGAGLGSPADWGLEARTTRSDGVPDGHASVDLGFHFPTAGYTVGTQVFVDRATGDDARSVAQAMNAGTPWRSITHALEQAATGLGWTVRVAPGLYDTDVETFPIRPVDTVSLVGAGYGRSVIDARHTTRVIQAYGVVQGLLEGFTLMRGYNQMGNNQADRPLYLQGCMLTLSRNLVMRNTGGANNVPGGILIDGGAPGFASNLIVSNTAGRGPGLTAAFYSRPVIENCTVAHNTAASGVQHDSGAINAAAVELASGIPTVRNCIVWGNTTNLSYVTSAMIAGSCVGGGGGNGFPGQNGNIAADPLFKAAGNYRLLQGSPCQDAGDTQPWMAAAADIDGRPRKAGAAVDIGAYEVPTTATLILIR